MTKEREGKCLAARKTKKKLISARTSLTERGRMRFIVGSFLGSTGPERSLTRLSR